MLVTHSLSESLQKQPSFRQSSADLFARQMRHIEQLATHVSTPPPVVDAPVAPARNTPPPIANSTAASRFPAAPEIIEDHPQLDDVFAEPLQVNAAEITGEPVEAETFFQAVDENPLSSQGVEYWPEPESPPVIFKEAEEIEPIAEPEVTIAIPLPERSTLAERRHRLRLLMKQTHPQPPVDPEVKMDVVPAASCEMMEEPAAVPKITINTPEPIEEIRTESAVKPKLIEWEQPDDIPSVDEIEAEALIEFEPAIEDDLLTTASTAQKDTHIAFARKHNHFIEWEQPEDDIPSIEDVMEARTSEETHMIRAIQFKPEDFQVAAAVRERIEAEPKISATTPITVEENGVSVAEPARFEFVPTLLDNTKEPSKPEPRRDYSSIFTSYGPVDSTPNAFPYRSMSIGLGLMIVAAIIGLGGDPLWRYFSAPEPSKPVTATAAPAPAGPLPARSHRSTDDEPPAPESEPPISLSDSEPVDEAPKHAEPTRSTTALPASPKARRTVRTSAPVSIPPDRTVSTPFAPSTVVITYGGGNARRSDSQQERPSNGSSRSGDPSKSGATRPRIVQIPPNR
jgi:hypothetical protein